MKQEDGDSHPEDHVEESVEEEAEEGSEDFCEGEDDPVIEVSDVVLLVRALQRQEGQVSGDEVANHARE